MRNKSVSAQLSRTARLVSAVIAPQLTKVEPIAVLRKHVKLVIRIANMKSLQEAIKQFVFHNNRHFDPVEFEICTPEVSSTGSGHGSDPSVILIAQFYADEIVLLEKTRRLLSICLSDRCGGNNTADVQTPTSTNPFSFTSQPFSASSSLDSPSSVGGFGTTLAKIRHPISGMKIFEVVESTPVGATRASWTINGMNELSKCRIETHVSVWRQALSACGFTFANGQWWSVEHAGIRIAELYPLSALWSENVICMEWTADADNEQRLLTLCFGVIQTIREAFPSLLPITFGKKRSAIM